MTPDELKSIPKGNFVVMKTGKHPMKTRLRLFLDWGISFEEPYSVPERSNRSVAYADRKDLADNLPKQPQSEDVGGYAVSARGGMTHNPAIPDKRAGHRPQIRT